MGPEISAILGRSRGLNGRGFLPSKRAVTMRRANGFAVRKKIEDFGGALKFLCYSLPLSKGL
jgi:hypothetical protein